MNQTRRTRRELLAGTAGVAIAGLAGCVGGSSGPGQDDTEDPHSEEDDPAGHGEEEHGHDLVSEPKQSRDVAVNTARLEDSTEFHFDPHVTWVEVGGTVTWTLESGTHTATAYHPENNQPRLVPEGSEPWDSGVMSEAGETFEHTFETEGVYHYLCRPHEQFGMLATVIVGNPHLDDQRALAVIPEDRSEEVHGKLETLNSQVREIVGEDDHHDGTTTEDGHDDGTTTKDGHHDETTTEDGH